MNFLKSATVKPNVSRLFIFTTSTKDSLEIVKNCNSGMVNHIFNTNMDDPHFNGLIPSYNGYLILNRTDKSITFKKVESVNSLFSLISDFSVKSCIKIK